MKSEINKQMIDCLIMSAHNINVTFLYFFLSGEVSRHYLYFFLSGDVSRNYCQAQVRSPKVKTKGTWADTKIPWATTTPPPLPNF